jgi:hypothetical protein
MRTSGLAISATFALAVAQMSFAQRAPEPQNARPPSVETVTVSDAELETFATIYADLLDTAVKFEAELNLAQTEEQAREIQGRAQTESLAKIAERGWTPERFNNVSNAIQGNPELTDRALKLIEEK